MTSGPVSQFLYLALKYVIRFVKIITMLKKIHKNETFATASPTRIHDENHAHI